jgi:lysophospholipase I
MQLASPLAQSLRIFWAHGGVDRQINYDFSLETAQALASDLNIQFRTTDQPLTLDSLTKDSGTDGLRFVTYDRLGHWIAPEEMKDLSVWIEACLPRNEGAEQRHSVMRYLAVHQTIGDCMKRTRTWFNRTT